MPALPDLIALLRKGLHLSGELDMAEVVAAAVKATGLSPPDGSLRERAEFLVTEALGTPLSEVETTPSEAIGTAAAPRDAPPAAASAGAAGGSPAVGSDGARVVARPAIPAPRAAAGPARVVTGAGMGSHDGKVAAASQRAKAIASVMPQRTYAADDEAKAAKADEERLALLSGKGVPELTPGELTELAAIQGRRAARAAAAPEPPASKIRGAVDKPQPRTLEARILTPLADGSGFEKSDHFEAALPDGRAEGSLGDAVRSVLDQYAAIEGRLAFAGSEALLVSTGKHFSPLWADRDAFDSRTLLSVPAGKGAPKLFIIPVASRAEAKLWLEQEGYVTSDTPTKAAERVAKPPAPKRARTLWNKFGAEHEKAATDPQVSADWNALGGPEGQYKWGLEHAPELVPAFVKQQVKATGKHGELPAWLKCAQQQIAAEESAAAAAIQSFSEQGNLHGTEAAAASDARGGEEAASEGLDDHDEEEEEPVSALRASPAAALPVSLCGKDGCTKPNWHSGLCSVAAVGPRNRKRAAGAAGM
jgi:hypothetical protein